MTFGFDDNEYLVYTTRYGHRQITTSKGTTLEVFNTGMAQTINQERARYWQANKKNVDQYELEEWAKMKIEEAYKLAHPAKFPPSQKTPQNSVSTPRNCPPDSDSDDDEADEADYCWVTTWTDHVGNEWQYMGDMHGSKDPDVCPDLWFDVDAAVGEIRCSEGNEPLWFKLKCEKEPLYFTESTSDRIQKLAEHPAVKKLLSP